MKKTKEELIKVYQDTKDKVVNDINPEFGGCYKAGTNGFKWDSIIKVVNMDSVSALIEFDEGTGDTCLLNMASAKKSGGGVERGEPTQEECLYRCSNLSHIVDEGLYPLVGDEFIYSHNVQFFKDADYNNIEPIMCDVVSYPAYNLNPNSYFDKEQNKWVDGLISPPTDYEKITKRRMRNMFQEALDNCCTTMILGAWGCGVFKNNPAEMAYMFKDVLVEEEYEDKFDQIIFPVINDENSTNNNFHYFEKILNNL